MTLVISGYVQKYVIFLMEKFGYQESLLLPFLTFNCSYKMDFYTNTFECGLDTNIWLFMCLILCIWLSEIIVKFDA